MAKASPSVRKAVRKKAAKIQKSAPLGSGKRFGIVEKSAAASGAKNPAAVAAAIGRKKYGNKKMTAMAVKGKKRAK